MSPLLARLQAVHQTVRQRFIAHREIEERWDMPPPGYNGEQTLRDDCDGFCLACRSLLRQQQINSRLVYCEIKGAGHLVVEVDGWILDLRQKTVVANTLLRDYHWRRISGYQPGEPWREILNP